MKLSVTTFRAGAQRLTALWQANQTARPSYGLSRLSISDAVAEEDVESLLPRRINSLDSFDIKGKKESEPKTPRSVTTLGFSQDACTDSVECGGGAMVVEGNRATTPPSPRIPQPPTETQFVKPPTATTPTTVSTAPPTADNVSSSTPSTTPAPPTGEETAVTTSSRSRWMKLRTTVQLTSAITQNKKPPLKREDSFLKRFSTRPIPDPSSAEGSSRLAGEGTVKSPFLGVWRSVVNPDENILFYWLSLLTLCLLYNAWTIIVRQAFPELQSGWSTMWFCLDGFTDVVFTLDIAFQFRTGYLEQGLMVCESRKLAGHYLRSRSFVLDILAIVPLDLVQIRFGPIPVLRFPRFLKLYRSFRLYYMVESRTIYPNLWRVVNLIHILLLLAHWFGCFYYLLSELEGFVGEWSYRTPINEYATLPRKYLGSVYWSTLTLTTIGDLATPATNLQYMFTIISYLIGVFIFATIVGQVGTVITNRNASRLEFERLLDGAKLYMRHHKVPRNMQRRVQRWYDYSWSRGRMQGGGDINSALGILPDKLKTELALHVNLKTLKKVSIFQECQPEFLHDLVLKMRAYIFTPGDLICRKGEVAREMFIIADGILEVISETGKVLTQMKAGDFFGEIGILNLDGFNRRTADVRSVGYSELFSLSREDILAAMKDYPEAQDILQTMGRKRLMEARLAANIGRATGNETNVPSSNQGEGGESGKPRLTVTRLKEDVRSLTKLLRTRSTNSGSGKEGTESIEMKIVPSDDESIPQKPTNRRRNVAFKSFIQKIQFKREDSNTSMRSFTDKLTHLRMKPEKSAILEMSSASTDESADSSTPLNKSLPLLQRVRLLGAQEKLAASSQPSKSSISKTSNVASAAGMFRSLDTSKTAQPASRREFWERVNTPPPVDDDQPQPPSPGKVKTNLSSILTAVIPKGSPKKQSPKKDSPPENKKPHLGGVKSRATENPSEIPLLKKVLLRKVMDDKKLDASKGEKEYQNSPSSADLLLSPGSRSDSELSSEEDLRAENGENVSLETVSNRVYLEQFSRTLGFHMSEDVTSTQKPTPRNRLNASSLTPSPSKDNIIMSDELSKESGKPSDNFQRSQSEPPKARLSRMMAVHEDSDETVLPHDDPFVMSTECQTEIQGLPPDAELTKKEESVDSELRIYLQKMVTDLETVIKAYSMEQQQSLLKENTMLKKDRDDKDEIIKKLLSQVKNRNSWENFKDVPKLETSTSSEERDINSDLCEKLDTETDNEENEEDRDLDDEEVLALQEKLKHQRKSWPTSVTIRRRLAPTRQSCSLDDEAQDPLVDNQGEMWRLEFPPPPPDMAEVSLSVISKPIYPVVPESLVEQVIPSDEEKDEESLECPQPGANDWEVKMLVEQFEENVILKKQKGRRHSTGEALSWDKVLRMRNLTRTRNPAPEAPRSRRKFSLVEGGLSAYQNPSGILFQDDNRTRPRYADQSSPMSQSTSYSSLMNIGADPKRTCGPTGNQRGRKASLPILQPGSSIGMSRWLSMDDVKSESGVSQNLSFQSSVSSGCSQETVIDMDTRLFAIEDTHGPEKPTFGTRSPSSPNVTVSDSQSRQLEFLAASRLSDWPSSPCLPTIREDEQCTGPGNSPLMSSPGRSFSHDHLPKSLGVLQNHKSQVPSAALTLHQPATGEDVLLDLDLQTKNFTDNTLESRLYSSQHVSKSTADNLTLLEDTSKSMSQNSVVISIPDCKSVLSP